MINRRNLLTGLGAALVIPNPTKADNPTERYLERLATGAEEYLRETRDGTISGIIYEPSEEKLQSLIGDAYKSHPDPRRTQKLQSWEKERASRKLPAGVVSVNLIPGNIENIGLERKSTILVRGSIPEIRTERQEKIFTARINHASIKGRDLFYGIPNGGEIMEERVKEFESAGGQIRHSPTFMRALLEMRASYEQITAMIRKRETEGIEIFLPIYEKSRKLLGLSRQTPYEKLVAEIELKRTSDLRVAEHPSPTLSKN